MGSKKKPSNNWVINLIVLFFTLLILFSILEVTLRLIEPKPRYEAENEFKFYEYSDYLGWKNKPYANGTFYTPDSKTYISINSKGLRDYEHSYNKAGNKERIQFYGNSFTWGYGVNADERYTNVFAGELDKTFPNKYEIINLGTSGYGTDQEYLLLKTEGIKYQPDFIIFAYHNDATDVGRKVAYNYPRPFYIIENNSLKLTNVPVPQRNISWDQRFYLHDNDEFWAGALKINYLLDNLKSYVFLRDRMLKISLVRNTILGKPEISEEERTKKALEVIEHILLEVKEFAEQNDAQFMLLIIPDKKQVYGRQNTAEIEHIVTFSEKNGILVFNILPELKEISKNNNNLYFEIDGHLSITGNEIVGKILTREFIKNKK